MRRRYLRPRNSLRGGGYQFASGPPIVQVMMEAWGCTATEREGVWKALCASCWTDTVELREQLIRFQPDPHGYAARAFLSDVFTPQAAVGCLERMVQERTISRRLATSIEERLLRHTGEDGTWQPHPSGGVRKGKVHRLRQAQPAPYVEPAAQV